MYERLSIPRVCQMCGKDFMAYKGNVKQGYGLFCSKSCARKMQRRKNPLTGEDSARWKGGKIASGRRKYIKAITEHPEKIKARRMLNKRIVSGKIVRGPCCVCGSTERIEAHHKDYAKPLEVVWFCIKHHREWHRNNPDAL